MKLTIQRRLNSGVQRRCPTKRVPGAPGQLGPPVVVNITGSGGANGLTFGDEGESVAPGAIARGKGKKALDKRKNTLDKRKSLAVTRWLKSGRRRIVLRQAPTTLAPGTYIARVTATTADGRTSTTQKVKFRVLRRAMSR
ncbi:MAG: hypothetical protein M3401_03440 [Actinomycetota bacterium]|nr:hypothetical protein [Actinomycetota bacterium]